MVSLNNDYKGIVKKVGDFLVNYPTDTPLYISILSIDKGRGLVSQNTPFVFNPLVRFGERYPIFYNEELMAKCRLTEQEQIACLLHEIGHVVNNNEHFESEDEKEICCDNLAIEAGIALDMMSALIKIEDKLDFQNEYTDKRLENLASQVFLFRPEWTCGKYNHNKRVALFYNLLEGMSHFFENESANVISTILQIKRNTSVSLLEIYEQTGIHISSLVPFIVLLSSLGLVTNRIYSHEEILRIRQEIAKCNRKTEQRYTDSSDVNYDDAEMEYTKAVGGITSVMFELTYRCSEQCIHCYNIGAAHTDKDISHRHERIEMTLEQYKSAIDQLCDKGMFRACLTGGDPFSYKYIWEILEYLKEKDVAFDVYTNGQQLLGNEQRLASLYPKTVGVSIYSAIPEVHDSITRVRGSLAKSIDVMTNLSKLAIPMYLKCCVMKPNFDTYSSVYELADKFSALAQIEVNVTDSVEGNKYVSQNLRLSEEEYNIVLKDKRIPLYVGKNGTMRTVIPRDSSANLCKAGINTFNVTPDGILIPCCRLHLNLGDLKVQSLSEILNHNETLEKWLGLTIKDYEECGKHAYCDFCNVCPGLNYSEHHNPLIAAENACFLAKTRYKMAIKEGVIQS